MTGSVLAVIPMRSGSKRLPGKNVAELDGKPLAAHTIKQANNATHVDEHVVSTESTSFKRIAQEHGGNVPFDRPPELATDDATNKDVLKHVLDWYSDRGSTFDIVCMLQVTSPFRTADDIDKAVELLAESDGNAVVSTTTYDTPPFWAVQTDDSDRFLRPYFGDEYLWSKAQTQSIPTLRHPNGAIYAIEVDSFRTQMNFYTDRTLEFPMPRGRSLDIDEPFDLKMARALVEMEEGQ